MVGFKIVVINFPHLVAVSQGQVRLSLIKEGRESCEIEFLSAGGAISRVERGNADMDNLIF
jgi:hypothetical protein